MSSPGSLQQNKRFATLSAWLKRGVWFYFQLLVAEIMAFGKKRFCLFTYSILHSYTDKNACCIIYWSITVGKTHFCHIYWCITFHKIIFALFIEVLLLRKIHFFLIYWSILSDKSTFCLIYWSITFDENSFFIIHWNILFDKSTFSLFFLLKY